MEKIKRILNIDLPPLQPAFLWGPRKTGKSTYLKEEYDFSKGERGKFFRNDIKLNLPVYLDDDLLEFVEKIAKRKTATNSWSLCLKKGD